MEQKLMTAAVKTTAEPGIEVKKIPVPEINDNQVLVKVKAAALCGSDVHTYKWEESMHYKAKFLPMVLGHEFSGEVVAVGKNVSTVKVGDRVLPKPTHPCGKCWFCTHGQSMYCTDRSSSGINRDGGFAEYAAIWEDQVVHMPEGMTYEQAALIEPMGVSANAIYHSGIKYGDFVVITGAGPIGLFATLMAKAVGAGRVAVVGTSRNPRRLELSKEMGADYTFMSDKCNVAEEIKKLTDGQGADVAVECVGSASLVQLCLDSVHKNGMVCCVGIYPSSCTINLDDVVRNTKKLVGSYSGPYSFERTVQWVTSNNALAEAATKVVSHHTPIEKIEEAFQRSLNRGNVKEIFTFPE